MKGVGSGSGGNYSLSVSPSLSLRPTVTRVCVWVCVCFPSLGSVISGRRSGSSIPQCEGGGRFHYVPTRQVPLGYFGMLWMPEVHSVSNSAAVQPFLAKTSRFTCPNLHRLLPASHVDIICRAVPHNGRPVACGSRAGRPTSCLLGKLRLVHVEPSGFWGWLRLCGSLSWGRGWATLHMSARMLSPQPIHTAESAGCSPGCPFTCRAGRASRLLDPGYR